MRDPAPVLAFLGAHNPRLTWLQGLAGVRGVAATARLAVSEEEVDFDPLVVMAGNGRVHGRLHLGEGGKEGVMLLSWGGLAAGLEFAGGRRDWKLVRPRDWYASRGAAR